MHSRRQRRRRAGALKAILISLGVIFGLMILSCAGCLTLMYFKSKPFMAEVFRDMATAPLASKQLPDGQRQRITANVDRVMNGVKDGQINLIQVTAMIGELSNGTFADLTVIELGRSQIAALLRQDEKRWEEASLVIDRFARGVSEGRISQSRIDSALRHISQSDEQGDREAKQSLTEVEAEDFLEAALKEADRARIPNERFQVDLAGELQRSIDKVLVGGAGTASAPAEDRPPKEAEPEIEPEATDAEPAS